MSFAALAVLLHFFVNNDNSLFNLDNKIYIYSFSMAIIGTVIPSYLIAFGIKRVGSGNAAIIGSIGPVSTIVQANFFLMNHPPFPAFGTGLILAGILSSAKNKAA